MDKKGQGEGHKIVVDASIVAKWIIPGEPWEDKAVILKDKIVSRDMDAYAPSLLFYEIASVLAKAISRKILRLEDAIEALDALRYLGIKIKAVNWGKLKKIIDIASEARLSVYDSTYLYLSRELGAKLVTADNELKKKGVNIAEVTLINELT